MTRLACTLAALAIAATACLNGCAAESAPEETSSTSAAVVVCAPGETLRGVDISRYQGNVDWAKIKASGKSFAFARISDGVNHVDNKFTRNWPGMKDAGLVRGSYQFFRPNYDPIAQADLVVKRIALAGGLKAGDLPPVLDLEVTGNKPASVVVSRGKQWIARIEAKLHVTPLIYTGNNMTPTIGDAFKDYLLWVPHYGVTCPRVPDAWATWTFWQDTDKGVCPGVSGPTDLNFFNGTKADLDALRIPQTVAIDLDPAELAELAEERALAAEDDGPAEATPEDGSFGATMGSGGLEE